ncbi:MAG: hypothetical protein KKH29_03700 [Candidatus Omnitrophica bacterium]|nr:hypothetical protein [Candidatus Omnitrophota bacterium]MCG2706796.1 hypothetical protein [Candidatus Omnitrophota bacterium]
MKNEIECPNCNSKNVIRKGRAATKFGSKQIYLCRDCGRRFGDRKLVYKTYGPRVITSAISYYNLGNTLEEAAKLVNGKYKVKVSKSSVHEWVKEFKDICSYHEIREKISSIKNGSMNKERGGSISKERGGKSILVSKTFEHNDLNYNFKFHKPKLEILCKDNGFLGLTEYIKGFERGCPDFFKEDERCSQLRVDIRIEKIDRESPISKLAGLALKAAKTNYERHGLVERFMLINDNATVACEVPVWLWEKNLDLGICGHIDLLQIRDGKIYVLDFKPEAKRENYQKVASQLYFYASGLSFRTRIPLENFRCVWFDDSIYYEFNPRKARVRFEGSKWRSEVPSIRNRTVPSARNGVVP